MLKLELILLGRFECLLSSDTRIPLSMRKAEALLAFLALTPGIRHPRERLINLLWSDRSDDQARNSLRQCLSAIKKSLGEAADLLLQVDRSTVSLSPGLIEVDVHEFERLAAEGDYESLVTAADLYQGEFLEGISIRDPAGQDWLDNERNRFQRQFIEILAELAQTQLLSHDFGHAIRSAERLVKQDPLGESGWRLLMRSYSESGDRSHALQAFKRCQQALRDELEVEPETATIELRDHIVSGESLPSHSSETSQAQSSPDQAKTPDHSVAAKTSPATRPSTDHSIAVLPFDNLSGDPEQEYFSDGITESIILNLSLFPGLNIKSRNSSFAFKQQIKSLGEISKELGVDYIVEGSIRRSNDRIRITVQLINTDKGNQLWGKRYDADLDDLFKLEEELSRSIAATVTGQIESELQRIAVAKGAAGQQAYDLLLSGTYHNRRFNRQDAVIAIEKLTQCLVQDPDNLRALVELYGCLSMCYLGRWTEDHQACFKQAEKCIRKALALGPELALVQAFYAEYLVFSGELDEAGKHLDRALEIHPNDTSALAVRALYLESRGEAEAALAAAERTLQLDPYHPWVEWELAISRYLCGHYQDALDIIEKSRTSPGFTRVFTVASQVKLGKIDAARQALKLFLQECREDMLSMPKTIDEWFQYTRENYPFTNPQINQDIIDCLVQAGLNEQDSSAAGEMPSIAVLPFENMSGDPEQEYFSDGITASIIVSLGLFNGITVKSQNSSFAFKHSGKSSEEIADELKATYLVEGSMRKSAHKVRISVQLIESASCNQIWGKQYDAELEDILELEQELSQTIAATISGRIGHSLQQCAVQKPARNLQSYDYLLRGLHRFGKFTSQDFVIAKKELEKCLEIDPENANAHTNLGEIHHVEVIEGWSTDPAHSNQLASYHLETAVEVDPNNALAHAYLAEFLLIHRDYRRSEFHVDQAIVLNPTASEGYMVKADLLASCRRTEEAIHCADQCLHLDPYSVGAGWAAGGVYRNAGQYDKAIKTFRSISHPPTSIHALIATCFIGLGLTEEARTEMRRYRELARKQMPVVSQTEDDWRCHWRNYMSYRYEEDFDRFFEQLIEAGLCDDFDTSSEEMPSIAVLPFDNMSGDPEQEYFSAGITTDIIATLSRFRHMRTVSRYSVLQYKDQRTSIPDIAAQQNVRYILEGSVRKSGDRIRVNAELIDSVDDQILWSERYDRDLDDLFAVQDEITKHIALAMKVRFDDGDMASYRSAGSNNIWAWELTLTAVDLQDTYIRKNIIDARSKVEEAIRLDPGYAFAQVVLSWTHFQEAYVGWCRSFEASINAADAANRKALDLDPDYAEAWSQAGIIQVMRHSPELAIQACQRAVDLEPGNAEIHALMAFASVFDEDYERALRHSQILTTLCPVRPNWYYLPAAQAEKLMARTDRAIELYQQGLDIEPDSPLCRFFLIDALLDRGNTTEAQQLADEIRALDQSVRGHGLVHSYSKSPELRARFRANLEQFDLY